MVVFVPNKATSAKEAEQIVPRAEFRVFGQGIIDIVGISMWHAQARLLRIRQSSERYILSRQTNETNVKIRDGLLDIKIKVGETKEGYEIFQPGGKFQFPVKQEELAAIFEKLRIMVKLVHAAYSLDEFLDVVAESPDLTAVGVVKERYGFSVDGVICEYGEILFNGALIETACAESEDYSVMNSVIEKLEIASFDNTNYLKAAKEIVGMS